MVHSQSLSDSFSYHFIGGQEMKNILVSVEGVDYTGKTTNAKGLANRIGAEYYKTPSNVFDDIRKIFNDSNDTVAKYLFYMSTLKLASEEIKKILEYRNVIVDRYLTTTICYHAICGAKIDVINVEKLDIRKPDFSFCLKVNNKTLVFDETRSVNNAVEVLGFTNTILPFQNFTFCLVNTKN